ncbi:MAG: histidine kinase, partial [Bacteroidales bacterium]|nr:histidine kinase [Bacteroidales bacterium]
MKKAIIFLFIIWNVTIFAQQYSYRQYTIFDGLPQNQVVSLCLDDYGFLWVGTKGGISRFDGKNFKKFESDNPKDNHIEEILNNNGDLYYQTSIGVYTLTNNKFVNVYTVNDGKIEKLLFGQDVESLFVVKSNEILKLTDGEIETIFTIWQDGYILDAEILPDDKILISNVDGVYLIDGEKQIKLANKYSGLIVRKDNINYFTEQLVEGNNSTWKLYKYENDESIVFLENKNVYHAAEISISDLGELCIMKNYHTWMIFDTTGLRIDMDSLPNNQINIILKAGETVFLGTENGLFIRQSKAFLNYTEKHKMPKYIWTIFETKQHEIAFAAYDTEMAILDKNNNLAEYSEHKELLDIAERFYMDGLCSSKGEWVIPTTQGVYFKNGNSQLFVKLMLNGYISTPLCCYEDTTTDTYLFGTTQGVFICNTQTKDLKNIQTDKSNVLDIEKDKFGRLWFCTNKKVFLFENDTLTGFKASEPNINESTVSCCRDINGNMWLAHKTGLYLYDFAEERKIYDGSFTFINNYKDTHIIAGSTFGILFIDLDKLYNGEPNAMRFMDRFNGFIGIECGQNGTCVDSKGNVWIPTSESVVKFMPDKLEYDTTPPMTYIYEFEYSSSDLIWHTKCSHPYKPDSIYNLDWTHNNMRFTFHGIEYSCPERVKYKYRLRGYSDSWTVDSTESVVFTNLDPGEYVFELYSCNENGYWTKEPTLLKIHIVPAFWQTIFFKIAVVLLSMLLSVFSIYLYMRSKRNKELEKRNVEQQLISMQMNTINAQLDPHFVFNAISAIGTEVQENNSAKAYDYYVKVSRLLRSSLIDKDKITRSLKKELDVVKDYLSLQQFRFGERIKFEINIAPEIDLDTIVPKMCIQIFVENAVKHGLENKKEGGEIKIDISVANNYLIVMILDNGIGRDAAAKINSRSTGTGLSAFKDFFEILNKYNSQKAGFTITDKLYHDGTAAGTEV